MPLRYDATRRYALSSPAMLIADASDAAPPLPDIVAAIIAADAEIRCRSEHGTLSRRRTPPRLHTAMLIALR